MYIIKKSLAVMLTLLLVLGMFALPAYAAETSSDGLAVTLTTDKKEYARGETITATLTVKNTNTVAVKNVTLESMIPAGYVLAQGDQTALQVEELAAGQTVTLTVRLIPQQAEEPTTNGNTPPKGDDPTTGDPFPMELLAVVLVLAMIGLGLLVVKYKAWKRVLSLVLCAAMLVSLVAGVPFEVFAAEEDAKTIDITTTVKVGGQQLNINARVKYAPVSTGGTEEGGSGGTTTAYHKITFANPAQEQYAPDTLPESCTVAENTLLYTLTEPEQDGYVFCGWYYDSDLTQVAATTDTVTSDLTLYPKMVERQGDPYVTGLGSLNYVSSLDVTPDFTVQVQAQSEQQIRDGLTFLEVSNFDAEVEYTVTDEGNGIYTLKPVNGLKAGSCYQIAATDRDAEPVVDEDGYIIEQDGIRFLHQGEVQPMEVRYYNITVYLGEYSNMRVNDDVIFLPYDQVEEFSFDDSTLFSTDLETINANNDDGSFVYHGNGLAVDDVIAIYDGVLNEDGKVDGEVAYVQITGISGSTYEYVIPGVEDVIFLPEALPMPMDDETTGDIDGAFFNEDGTLTVYNEYLNFERFADIEELKEMELDGSTTADVGDYLVLYWGELPAPSKYAYYEITGIAEGDGSAVTVFTLTEKEDFEGISAYEIYHDELAISEEAVTQLEEETKQQALDSGFVEDAAQYLARTLIKSGKMPKSYAGMELSNVAVRSQRGGDQDPWYDGGNWDMQDGQLQIEAGQIEAGVGTLMLEVGKVDVHVKSTKRLQEITGMDAGVRLELGLHFPVQIGTYLVGTGWTDCVNLTVSASFVQEVAFSPYAKLDIETGRAWIFPYIKDILVEAGVDVGTYVGVGGTFTVVSGPDFGEVFPWVECIKSIDPKYDVTAPNVDSIARTLEDMMGKTSTFLDGKDGKSLVGMYRELLEKDMDYVQILAIKCPGFPIKIKLLYGVLQITISLELAISAKMSVTVGMATELLSVKRYYFSLRLFSCKASSGQMDLQTPYTNFNIYLMGNLGLRVGPRVGVSLAALSGAAKKHNLANVGFSLEFGYANDIYGIFFYHFRMENGKTVESRGVGALDSRHGIYLDLDFSFGAFLDLISATLHAVDLTYYISKLEDNYKVLEPSKPIQNHTFYNKESFNITSYHLMMNLLQVKSGSATQKRELTIKHFDISLSNPKFVLNKKTGAITYTAPDENTVDTCEVRLTYLGSDTLFQVAPMVITMNLTWRKTMPKYSVNIYTDTFLGATSLNGFIWGTWPDRDTKVWEKVYVAGEIIGQIPFPDLPEKVGYDFKGWHYSDSGLEGVEHLTPLSELNNLVGYKMPEGNIDIVPIYEPRTDTPYKVEYYVQSTDGSDTYEFYDSADQVGTTGDSVASKVLKEYKQNIGAMDGFDLNYGKFPTSSITVGGEKHTWFQFSIKADGSSVAKVYFDRQKYSATFHVNNDDYSGSNHTSITDYYGAPLNLPEDLVHPKVPGWEFDGWMDHEGNIVDLPKTMPVKTNTHGFWRDGTYYQGGTHYFAKWLPKYNLITINHYLEQPDGSYALYETQVGVPDPESENYRFGGLTGEYICKDEFLLEIDGAHYSHYKAVDADGMSGYRVVGADSNEPGMACHNGQTLNLYYDREYYRAAWNTDGINYVTTDSVISYFYDGQQIAVPEGVVAPEKPGYDLVGWKNIIGSNPGEVHTDDAPLTMGDFPKLFVPNYVPKDGTPYTVEHYLQRTDGVYADRPDETQVLSGKTESLVKPEVNSYTGFDSPVAREVQIAGDGSTVVKYRYPRKTYEVIVDYKIEGENLYLRGRYTSQYRYGATFELTDPDYDPLYIHREGYRLVGWYLADEELNPDKTLLDPVDYKVSGDALFSQRDLVFKPMWEKIPHEYRVEHYLEQLDGSYILQQTDQFIGYKDDVVTAQTVQFTGFTFDETNGDNVCSGTVTTDGSLVLKLHYSRNSYQVKWYAYDGTTVLATTEVKYKDAITPPETYDADLTRHGYTMTGWKDADYGAVTTAGASFTAADYGLWTANPYEVAFMANGGQGAMENQSFTYDQTQSLTANGFTRPGYAFAGWSYTPTGSVLFADREQVTGLAASGVVTLFAIWNAKTDTPYAVEHYGEALDGGWKLLSGESFTGITDTTATAAASAFTGFSYNADADNVTKGNIAGDGSLVLKLYYSRNSYTLSWLDYDGTELASQSVLFEAPIAAPDAVIPQRMGYRFLGWNVSGTMPAKNTSFSAKQDGNWSANTYTVSFDANGGQGTMENQSFTYDQAQFLQANSFIRKGYIFAGWSTEPGGKAVYADQQQIENLLTSGTAQLYAVWTAGDGYGYRVEHYVQQPDGSYRVDTTASFSGVMDSEVSASSIRIQGYTFNADHPDNVLSGTINAEGTLVLKLHYDLQSYTATLADEKGAELASWKVPYGGAVTVPADAQTPVREGYTFTGWADLGIMPAKDMTYSVADYGSWKANTYTVTFDANGGEGKMDDQTFTYDKAQTLSANSFQKTGYTFAGWSLNREGAVKYADQAKITNLAASGTVTLYAQWNAGNTSYKVICYGEKPDGTGFEKIKTEERTGKTGSTVSAADIAIDGFTYDAANGDQVTSGIIAGDGSLVLKLYYTRNSYTLTLDLNGESMKQSVMNWDTGLKELTNFEIPDQTFTVKHGQTLAEYLTDIKVPVLMEEGYWTWSEELQEDVYIDPVYEQVAFETAFPGYTFGSWEGLCDTMPTKDLTLTAQWDPITITVTFHPGSYQWFDSELILVPVTETFAYGSEIEFPDYFAMDNCTITGWYVGESQWNYPFIVEPTLSLVYGYFESFEDVTEVTIAPYWVVNSSVATITFNGNGGEGSMTPMPFDASSGYGYGLLPRNKFTREGYVFTGWNTAADGSGEAVPVDWFNLTSDTTLYAQWEEKE